MGAIPLPDQGSQSVLDSARQDAEASLRTAYPGKDIGSMLGQNKAPAPVNDNSVTPDTDFQASPPPDATDAPPSPGAVPPKDATPAPPSKSHGNGDIWSASNLADFLRDESQGSTKEIGFGVMRGLARVGNAGYTLAAGTLAAAADHVAGALLGTDGQKKTVTGAEDAVFDFKKKYIDPAIDSWTPDRNAVTGQGDGSGGLAQALGSAAEIIPILATGGVGQGALIASTGVNSATDELAKGHSMRESVAAAAVDTIATALQAELGKVVRPLTNAIPAKVPELVKQMVAQVPVGDTIAVAQDLIKKQILARNGHPDEAAQIDPLANLGTDSLQNAVFAVLGGHGEKAEKPPAGPSMEPGRPIESADQTTGITVGPNPPGGVQNPAPVAPGAVPPVPPVAPKAPEAAPNAPEAAPNAPEAAPPPAAAPTPPPPVEAAPAPTVPDHPTPEPAKDIRAQLKDMNDSTTPRVGVFITTENQQQIFGPDAPKSESAATIQRQMEQARKTGRVIDTPQGTLILKDKATALKAQMLLKNGTDPQLVLGKFTGAGDGKQVGDTAVVQGQTPDGAVATETSVRPDEVPAAVQAAKDQGKTPVVTTPEAAIQRRAEGVQAEQSAPPPDATDMRAAVQQDDKDGPAKDLLAQSLESDKTKPGDDLTTMRSKIEEMQEPRTKEASEKDDEAPTAQRGIIKTKAGDRAVIVHDATPDAEGKIRVSPIDEEGEAGPEIRVPADSLASKTDASPPAETAGATTEPEAKPETAKPAAMPEDKVTTLADGKPSTKPIDQLADATRDFLMQDTPSGKRKLGGLPERVSRVAEYARTLKSIAATMDGDDASHAYKVADKYDEIDMKSAEDIAHNKGVGHTEMDVARENMVNAARKLIEPDFERPPLKKAREVKFAKKVADGKTDAAAAKRQAEIDALAKEQAAEDAPPPKKLSRADREKAEAAKTKVIADVEDETKPKVLSKAEELKLRNAGNRFRLAEDDEVDARRSDVDKILKEIYGKRMSDKERTDFMKVLDQMREDERTPKTRDQEIEDEFADQRRMDTGEDADDLGHRVLGFDEVDPKVTQLHLALEKAGVYNKLREGAALKREWDAKHVLQVMAGQTDDADLKSFIQKIALHTPEQTKIRPVDVVRNTTTGKEMSERAGQFELSHNLIQLGVKGYNEARMTHTLLHEATHAATYHLIVGNRDHPYVREAKNLRQILIDRLKAQYGHDLIQSHIDYFNKKGPKPEKYAQALYGLMNPAEMHAEAASNPKFRELIARSEKYKQPGEGFLNGAHTLAKAMFENLKRLLGMQTPGEGTLLGSIMRNTENLMEAQSHFLAEKADAAVHDLHSLASLNDDPRPLKNEARLRDAYGHSVAVNARQWYRAVRTGSIHALRRLVLADEKPDQMVRSNAHWFGRDDETNPLRQWDETKKDAVQAQNKILEHARKLVLDRQALPKDVDKKLGQLQIDSQQWGFDPTKDATEQTKAAQKLPNFKNRFADFQNRWHALDPRAQAVFLGESAHNAWEARLMRKTGVDASLDSFTDKDIPQAQRALLYSARTKGDFDSLIGTGKQIDVGDRNEALKSALQDLAAFNQVKGHYFHLGRTGDYVVSVNPEVDKNFDTQQEAEAHADLVRSTGPNAKATVAELGGKWNVSGKSTYLSRHTSWESAKMEQQRLLVQGHDVDPVTTLLESQTAGSLPHSMQSLVAAAQTKLERRGSGPETQALTDALRNTFVQMVAHRSEYAASKLARQGFGGVKPEEMGRNFAAHVQSSAWNIANLATTFKQGEALGKLRASTKDRGADETTLYKRGAVMQEIGKRTAQEVSQSGLKNPVNAVMAKMGYANYLASPAHTIVNLTQNFTTALPVAGAKFGYGRALDSFGRATAALIKPTLGAAGRAWNPKLHDFNVEDMVQHGIDSLKGHKDFGKYVPHLKTMLDRGVLNSTFAAELGHQAQGGNRTVQRVFDAARVMPQMAEVYNRISTALVGLENTNGNIQKASDLVLATHLDYSQQSKTRVGKMLAKVPGANTVTMFRTYVQGMRHLLYSNVKNMVFAESKSRAEAAKTVAGLLVGQGIFAGVIGGAMIEPVRATAYLWHQLFGDKDDYYDFDNTVRHFLSDAMGSKAADVVGGGLPHLLGFDLSGRMGLSDLFLHNPPDLLHSDTKTKMAFLGEQLGGPMGQMVAENIDGFSKAIDRGDAFGALAQIIPIKQLRNLQEAYAYGTEGKRAGNGGQLTPASGLDAAYQAIGLKPSDVADAQQRQGAVINYKNFTSDRKQRLLRAWDNTSDPQSVMSAIQDYNAKNPGDRIKPTDLRRQGQAAMRTQEEIEDGRSKDPDVDELLRY
jgi:hypothetical protein